MHVLSHLEHRFHAMSSITSWVLKVTTDVAAEQKPRPVP
jgi:hypothetical protein